MDEILEAMLKALPAGSGAMAIAIVGLVRQLLAERKECREERLESNKRERELIKEVTSLTTRLLLLHEKLRRGSGPSSNPPPS